MLSGASSGLAVSLTAIETVVGSGSQVSLTFTETNVSHHTITVVHGPTNEGFTASRNGKTLWISNPGLLPQFLELDTLKPGQSIALHATWDGRSNQPGGNFSGQEGPSLTGTFTVVNELDPSGAHATVKLQTTSRTTSTHIIPPVPPRHFFH